MHRTIAAGLVLTSAVFVRIGAQQPQEPPRFRVGVDAVRIDAVVTDGNGRVVRDLTANDFEILQDGKPQKVTSAEFISLATTTLAQPLSGRNVSAPGAAPPPAVSRPFATPGAIQRTFAIVVDDLSMSVESMYYAKRALHAFVDAELQPADLVALVRTGGSLGGLQPFTTDHRVLHAGIDHLRWNGFSRSGVESFEPLNKFTTFDDRTEVADANDFASVGKLRGMIMASGALGALNLVIRGARDLPGRKAVMFVSEGFQMLDSERLPDSRVRAALDRVIDQAARAGAVVYALDPRGLQTGGLQAGDNLKRPDRGTSMDETVRAEFATRSEFLRDTQEGLAYLAEQTGGFAVLNQNDLSRGMGRVLDDVRDYYIIGYTPSKGTFADHPRKATFHKVTVKTRRPGLKVRTRKEFLGFVEAEAPKVAETSAHQLIRAAISPFTNTEIAVRATPLPGFLPARGLFVRTLLHIDARALEFVEGEDGKKTASADVLGMVFNRDGTEVAHLSTGFSVALTSDAAEDALREGLAYTLRVPIPRAGPYQLRFSVRDQKSGRIGSAGEFIDVPDIPGGDFALSGIVLRSNDGDAAALWDADQITISPRQAVRAYKPGVRVSYAYEIYNAAGRVESATTIWRGTQKVLDAPAVALVPPPGSEARFAAAGTLKLGDALPAGTYILQIAATTADTKRRGRVRTATQQIDFEVR